MIRDLVVAGIGRAGPFRHQEKVGVELAAVALQNALRDAGLHRHDIDGLVVNMGGPSGPDYDQLARFADLKIETAYQTWAHGRFTASVLHLGLTLVEQGLANRVACVYGYHLDSDEIGGANWRGWAEENRFGGGPHGEEPAIGLTAPAGTAAMAVRTYCERYDVDPGQLYDVCTQFRGNAGDNPSAFFRAPLTRDEYEAAPILVDPLRRFDYAPVTEGAACMIVTRPGETGTAEHRPVHVLGFQGLPGGRQEHIWSRPGLGMAEQDPDLPFQEPPVFARAGVTREDIDLLYVYDAFSPLVWFALERWGYCPYGQAPTYVEKQGLSRDAELPVNSHGGMLNEGHLSGWGHLYEAVTQLRGEAGPRQVGDARLAHWGPVFGESVILGAAR